MLVAHLKFKKKKIKAVVQCSTLHIDCGWVITLPVTTSFRSLFVKDLLIAVG